MTIQALGYLCHLLFSKQGEKVGDKLLCHKNNTENDEKEVISEALLLEKKLGLYCNAATLSHVSLNGSIIPITTFYQLGRVKFNFHFFPLPRRGRKALSVPFRMNGCGIIIPFEKPFNIVIQFPWQLKDSPRRVEDASPYRKGVRKGNYDSSLEGVWNKKGINVSRAH